MTTTLDVGTVVAELPSVEQQASPQISPLPKGCPARVIDAGMLHYEASVAGFAERYGRGETSHTIHVWWARRPHSAMRALVFASLCKDSTVSGDLMVNLSGDPSNTNLAAAHKLLAKQYKTPPRVLDMFGGGGTIPLEAAALAAESYSIDANQLSVFIQRCNLVYSQGIEPGIQDIVRDAGTRILTKLANATKPLFPLRSSGVFAYIWTYTLTCTSCSYEFFLSKRAWLSRKKGKTLGVLIKDGKSKQTAHVMELPEDGRENTAWVGRGGTVACPKCGESAKNIDIATCADRVVALVRPVGGAGRSGKEFVDVLPNAEPDEALIVKMETEVLKRLRSQLPSSELPRWSGIVNPALYGVRTHADFLNRRQRLVLLLLIDLMRQEYESLCNTKNLSTARYVVCLLSSLIDQIVDWNCRLSMWIPQNEQVGRSFCGPGISMLWDYAESDPAQRGPANLWSKLDRIVAGAGSIPQFLRPVHVEQAHAQRLPFESEMFDAIVTDPPYYDNIFYSVLADFFFAWKRLLLQHVEPDLFKMDQTDHHSELVASKFRSGSADKAHQDYCAELGKALSEAERVLKRDGVFTFVYSHSSFKGWDALIKAYRATNFVITSVQPLSIERKQRPRAMTSDAVNTCIAFVARRNPQAREAATLESLSSLLADIGDSFADSLLSAGWNESDTALAVYAHAVGMVANASSVSGAKDDLDALVALESIVRQRFPEFKVTSRGSI